MVINHIKYNSKRLANCLCPKYIGNFRDLIILWIMWRHHKNFGRIINSIKLIFQMQFMLLFSRQGKLRLQKWYAAHPDKVKKKITRELITTILARKPKMCSFLEWKDCKIVYKRFLINWNHYITNPLFNQLFHYIPDTQVYIFVVQSNKMITNCLHWRSFTDT